MKRITQLIKVAHLSLILFVSSCGMNNTVTEENSVVLENSRLALIIGANDGAVQSIHDKSLDIYHELKGMALCDQWWTPNKEDINQSRYLFLPIHMDEKMMYFAYIQSVEAINISRKTSLSR